MASPYCISPQPSLVKPCTPSMVDAGYESSSDGVVPSWEIQFTSADLLSPFDFTTASTTDSTPSTPSLQISEPYLSSSARSPSPKKSPQLVTSEPMSEEERRRSRKREQNRESQRAFRRRQENRVKFLEGKTLELEASSRYLRAENAQLKQQLLQSESRNDALMSMISAPPSRFQYGLEPPPTASTGSSPSSGATTSHACAPGWSKY